MNKTRGNQLRLAGYTTKKQIQYASFSNKSTEKISKFINQQPNFKAEHLHEKKSED